jgi:hypothetical protein
MIDMIRKAIHHWDDNLWWRKVAFPYAARVINQKLPNQGIYLPDEEWDNLLILDACRYDMFAEETTLPGQLLRRTSAASNTPEFLKHNFEGQDFSDTVYVTANPQVNIHLDDEFFGIINVWESHWDDELHTVPPKHMAKKTITAYNNYPNKRIVSHFIQPHYPFIGKIGQEKISRHSGMELSKRMAMETRAHRDEKSIWNQLYAGTVSPERVYAAYRENLDIAIPYVLDLIKTFEEHTVITSDHGNALGERAWPVPAKIYGHPPGIRIPALTEIPWLVTNTETRKEIQSGKATSADVKHKDSITERLADLGYR